MRRLLEFLVLGVTLAAPSVTPAQGMAARAAIRAIRAEIGVDDSTPIVLASSPELPKEPLRVYLAVGLDASARNFFTTATRDWNKKHGKKYRTVELVDDLSAANVVYVYTERPDLARSETQTTTSTVQVADPNGGPARNEVVPTTSTTTVYPARSYRLVRSGSGFGVLDRSGRDVTPNSTPWLHQDFWTRMQRLLGYKGSPTRFLPLPLLH